MVLPVIEKKFSDGKYKTSLRQSHGLCLTQRRKVAKRKGLATEPQSHRATEKREGEKGRRGEGDKEKRRQGDKETRR
jgi:hypothetical protein